MIVPIEEVLRMIGSINGRDIVARLDRDHVRAMPVTGASADERGIECLADTKDTHDCDMGPPCRPSIRCVRIDQRCLRELMDRIEHSAGKARISFNVGKADIGADVFEELARVAKIILRTTMLDEVKGHCCAQRTAGPEHAEGLSQDVMRVGYMLKQAVRRDAVD